MTARGWWFLLFIGAMLLVGVLGEVSPLIVTGLALLSWFGCEWMAFADRVRSLRQTLSVRREVCDERGPVSTLWAGRFFTVRLTLRLHSSGRLPHIAVADPVPFGVQHDRGDTTADGELSSDAP